MKRLLVVDAAADLHFIIAALKINDDLERMGDLHINIAERSAYLSANKPLVVSMDFSQMVES